MTHYIIRMSSFSMGETSIQRIPRFLHLSSTLEGYTSFLSLEPLSLSALNHFRSSRVCLVALS